MEENSAKHAEELPAAGDSDLPTHEVTKSKDVEGSPKHKVGEAKKRRSVGAVEESSSSRPRPKLLKLPFLEDIKSRRAVGEEDDAVLLARC